MNKSLKVIVSIVLCAIMLAMCGCGVDMSIKKFQYEGVTYLYYPDSGLLSAALFDEETTGEIIKLPDTIDGRNVAHVDFMAGNSSIRELHIGKYVESIFMGASEGAENFSAYYVDEENVHFYAVDGVLYYKDMIMFNRMLVDIPTCYESGTYILPDNVTQIRPRALHCKNLRTLVLHENFYVLSIFMFLGCETLESVVINSNIPPRVEDGTYATYLAEGKPLENLKFYVPVEAVESYKASADWSDLADRIFPIEE